MIGEKMRKLDALAKLLQAMSWEVELYVDKTVRQLTEVRTPRRIKFWEYELRKLATANIAFHFVLTEKSELSLNDKDVAWSLRFLEILTWKQSSTISRAKKCGVMKLFAADFFQKVHIDRVTETRVTSICSLLGILHTNAFAIAV